MPTATRSPTYTGSAQPDLLRGLRRPRRHRSHGHQQQRHGDGLRQHDRDLVQRRRRHRLRLEKRPDEALQERLDQHQSDRRHADQRDRHGHRRTGGGLRTVAGRSLDHARRGRRRQPDDDGLRPLWQHGDGLHRLAQPRLLRRPAQPQRRRTDRRRQRRHRDRLRRAPRRSASPRAWPKSRRRRTA